jgi:hypothetical protein
MRDLEKKIRAERKKLIAAAETTGIVDDEAFERLQRLSRLADESRPPRIWLIPLVAFSLLTIFVVLLVARQKETEIEMDLTVEELHFRLSKAVPVVEDQFLRAFNANSLSGVVLNGVDWPAPSGVACRLNAEIVDKRVKTDAITLPVLVFSKNSDLSISRSGVAMRFGFRSAGLNNENDPRAFSIRAFLRGKAVVSTDCNPDGALRALPWTGPSSLTLRFRTTALLTTEPLTPVKFARQIPFENLRLVSDDRDQTGTAPEDTRHSSVLSGTLFLDALNAKPLPLRPFEDLAFTSSRGYIRTISLPLAAGVGNEDLHLQGHAGVQGMTFGAGINKRSRMPNLLEWLSAQTSITLLWAATAYVFGIVLALLRWLGYTR